MKTSFKTDLICINSGTPLYEARSLMREKRIRHLPVINHEKEVIGIFSHRDFIGTDRFQDLPVDVFASAPVEFVTPDTPLRSVALKMLEKKISSVLLTDNNKKVLGIITTDDLLFHLTEVLKCEETETTNDITKSDKDNRDLNWLDTAGELFKKLSDVGI